MFIIVSFLYSVLFLSTLSVRRATLHHTNIVPTGQISIHALREESDSKSV